MIRMTLLAVGVIGGLTHGTVVMSANVTRLTNTINSYPDPSPDGSKIIFQSNRSGKGQIFIMDANGDNVRQLTNVALGAETPVWSPDGKWIAYAAYVAEGNNEVFVMKSDGSKNKQLTDSPGYDGHPHWTFDGARIVFNSDQNSPDPNAEWSDRWHEIFSMKPNGKDMVQHTRCQSVCTYGSLSPDGSQVLYRKTIEGASYSWFLYTGTRNSEVFVANADGSDEINLSQNAAFDGWPIWSPDGSRIAFASNRAGPAGVGQIFTVRPDGNELRQITNGPWSYAQPAWAKNADQMYAYQCQETLDYEFGDIVRIDLVSAPMLNPEP